MIELAAPRTRRLIMAFEFRHRSEIDRGTWDAFVDASDEAWLWHRSDLINAISCRESSEDISFGAVNPEGELLAIVPLYRLNGFRFSKIPVDIRWLYCAGGPAVVGNTRPHLRRKVMAGVTRRLPELIEEHGASFLEARLPALTPYLHGENAVRVNPLFHFGFANTSGATWMIDLTPTHAEIRRRYSETTRQCLKKAASTKFILREASGSGDLETYYKLHLATIGRLNRRPIHLSSFKRYSKKCSRSVWRASFSSSATARSSRPTSPRRSSAGSLLLARRFVDRKGRL